MPTARSRLVVLVSGSGTNLAALLDATRRPDYPADVVAVGSDRDGIGGLAHAHDAGIPAFVLRPEDYGDRTEWDSAFARACAHYEPDWVVSAGFMKILGETFLAAFPGHVINTHPALLPSFPGTHGVRDALDYGVKVTGVTVHVVDAGVDTGPVLSQMSVDVLPDDSEATLHERIKTVERKLLVDTIAALAANGVSFSGRKASIP